MRSISACLALILATRSGLVVGLRNGLLVHLLFLAILALSHYAPYNMSLYIVSMISSPIEPTVATWPGRMVTDESNWHIMAGPLITLSRNNFTLS